MHGILRFLDRCVPVITFIIIVGGWETIVRVLRVPVFIVPPPSLVVKALWFGLSDGTILRNLYYTLMETLSGYGLAILAGVGLGSLISQVRWVDRAIYPYIVGFQSVPKMALAPLLVLWFGFGLTSKVLVAAMVAFFPILVNTIEGLHNTDVNRIVMLRSFGATEWQVFRMIKQPSALPFIFAGLDTGIVLSLLGAVVGEFVGARVGLGNLIMMANYKMDIATMFAILLVLSIVGISLHLLLVAVQQRVVFWAGKRIPTGA